MGWGMAGGGADPAALLRLYMRFGRLDDALARWIGEGGQTIHVAIFSVSLN